MAHEVETMMSVNEVPWHGLGAILQAPPTSAEAMEQAGLNWTVSEQVLHLPDGRPVEAKAIVRDSDGKILGHSVGKNWTPVQNRDVFGWFDPLVSSGQATYETAGSLRGGTRVWVLAKLGGDDLVIVPKADDRVARYLLLANSHDGTLAVTVGFTPIRVVCANTLKMALCEGKEEKQGRGPKKGDAGALLKVLHTKGVNDTLGMVRDAISVANRRFEATAEAYRKLAARDIDATTLTKYVTRVFEDPQASATVAEKVMANAAAVDGASVLAGMLDEHDAVTEILEAAAGRESAAARARREMVESLFEHGRGNDLPGVAGTAWAAYNAVTEYLQYERPRTSQEQRIDSMAFADGSQAKTARRALDYALELV